ncbi:CARDB domain-containing protein, partial [uncultured Rubinisphaera sp.]|uniref:CARDB domain-containing protein n=1 Tax=uncultured Rubinisphaera sp. TaxID=1678686 RepID=UPI0030DCE626
MNDSHRMNAENKKQDARFLWFVRFLKRSRTQKRGRLRQVNTEALESRLLLSADFLDAPISFSSYLEDDGPHQTTTGQWLGSSHDLEINAIRSAGANSGVNTGEADEDGMAFSQLRSGTLQAIPDAPEFLDVSGRGENWIRLDWSDAPGAINYYLERYDPISKEWKQIYYARESHYLDRGTHLIPGISYQYRVRSENAERELSEYSMLVEESIITGRGRIEGKFWIGREEIFSENEFDVSILSHSDHGINEDRNTWILIHGWGGLNPFSGFNPITEGWIDSFSETLNRLYPEDTILSYNWHDASNTGPNAGISEARIPFAAEWLGLHLWELGFGEKLKFVGHSHGAYVANEAAKVIPVKERAIIAIDPADDAPGALDINAITNFRESACLTWAFVDGDRVGANVGNVLTAATASHSFLVKNTTHTRLPKFVENLISNQTLASKYFSFDNLSVLDHENIWIENAFDGNGDEDRNNGEHEAVFWSDSNDHVERFRIRDVRTSDNRYEDYPVDQSLVNIQFSGFGPSTFENIAPSTFDDTASSGVFADSVSESFSIREAYQNFAPQPTGQFDVVYYASRTGLSTTPLFELAHRTVTNLDVLGISGSTQSFSYDQIPVEAISGGRTYVGVAKNPAEVQSADDILWFNMDIPASFGQPDLIVEDFAIEPVAAAYAWSRSLESSFRIQNVGSGYAGPFTAKIFLSADPQITTTDYYLGEHRFDGLQGRSTTGTSILFSLPESLPSGASDGTYYLGVIADPENSVTEGDDTNNSNRGEGSDRKEIVINSNLPANGEPVISSLSVDPSVVVRGEFITFLASGVADDEHVNDVRFFQETSGNGVLDEDDLLVGYGSYSELTTEYRLRTMSSHLQLGSSKIYAQATDNEGNLSAVVSVPIVINGNGPAVPDEYEFNNDLSTAHYLGSSANFQLNGSITPDDRDFFVFDMPLGEADISVGLSFFEETDGRGDLTLELRRMTGATTSSQVGFSDRSQPGQTGESISIADASKGRYVVIVNGQNNAANPYYSLSVVLHPRSGAPRVGDLVISSSAVHAGEQVDVWFESVSGSLGGNDGAAFYLDDDSSGKITGSETLLGVDYGSQPSLNGKFGTSFNTSGFSAGIHLIHGYIFSSFGESVPRTAVLEIVPNEVPVIGNLNAPSTLKAGEAGRILVEGVSDVDGEVVSVSVFRDSNGDGRWSGDDLRLGDATLINGSWELDFNTSQWERSTHLLFALAVDDDGEESTPESVNVEILPVPPDAPDGVRATGGGYTDRVVVNWLESDSADRYIVYRSENVEEAAGTEIGLTQALQFEDHSGIKGRTYRYWVVAANDDGISELSSYTTGFRNAPDLVPIVAEVNGVFTSGQTISVNSVIQNLSTATADSAQLSFYFSENDTITPLDRLIKTIQLPIVSGSATFDWVEALEIPEDMPGGEYFVGIIVDVEDSLPELNDFNNAFAGDNFFVNIPPAISVTALLGQMAEDQHINDRIKVAQFDVKDDGIGLNEVSLSGPDAALFEIDGADLFLKANASLDFETNPILDVVVQVDDTSVGNTPDDTAELSINVTDVNEAPTLEFSQTVTELIENTDTSNAIKVADIVVTDDALGSNVLSLTGADANLFDIIGTELFLKGGVVLDYEQQTELQVIVQVDDVAIGDSPDAQQSLTISLIDTTRIDITSSSLGYGIPGQDNATGAGFILYSQQSVQQRFAGAVVANGAENFVVVRYLNNQWQYANNDVWVDFTPTTGDRLIAAVDFDSSQVQMLQGSSGSVNGINQGYVEGDLTITPNQ